MEILARKKKIRTAMRNTIAMLSDQEKVSKSLLICELLQKIISPYKGKTIAVFLPLSNEPKIDALFTEWEQAGYTLFVPGGTNQDPYFVTYANYTGDHMGIGSEAVRILQVDIVLVPGVAFTSGGKRLGRGGGWYDRAIASTREIHPDCRIIGVCFAEQIVNDLPIDKHDQLMDKVVCA